MLGTRESGESDRSLVLFTRDFGLIWARGSAVRRESSKMRGALQTATRSRVSLIKGKQGWRMAGATALETPHPDRLDGARAFARIAVLVRRLVAGEEVNEYLYDTLAETHRRMVGEVLSPEIRGTVEIVCVARMLYSLGYISNEALSTALFTHTAYEVEHLAEAETVREGLLTSINKALTEAQL